MKGTTKSGPHGPSQGRRRRVTWLPGFPGLAGFTLLGLGGGLAVQAHESYMDCFENQDETITCQAGYTDGSPPSSQDRVLVKDEKGTTLITGQFGDAGNFTFARPAGDGFMVVFIGGEIGHTRRINARDLVR